LMWGAATACPDAPGTEICDAAQQRCVPDPSDVCTIPDVQLSCENAVVQLAICCSDLNVGTVMQFCHDEEAINVDPRRICHDLAASSCQDLHDGAAQVQVCCCPSHEKCDASTPAWACESP